MHYLICHYARPERYPADWFTGETYRKFEMLLHKPKVSWMINSDEFFASTTLFIRRNGRIALPASGASSFISQKRSQNAAIRLLDVDVVKYF